ncbi:MAG: pantetheine-phosphate adenylyltransferase [Tenacibaculum sp.]|nr:pantetheine-phosphate adenylyltransferase [Tenacibaculum sp.]
MKRAIFPGSFDPITLGHYNIIQQGVKLFDELVIAIGVNSSKKYMFSLEDRKKFIEKCFKNEKKIKIVTYEGLTVNYCKAHNINFILRGLRNSNDFEYEKGIAHANKALTNIETVFLLTSPETSYISSSIVRDIIKNNGNYANFVPKSVRI